MLMRSRRKLCVRWFIRCGLALAPIEAECATVVPARVWKFITPKFFAQFWTFSMYDLEVPSHTYRATIAKVKQDLATYEKDNAESSSKKKKKERTRVDSLLDALKLEETQQKLNVRQVLATVDVDKDSWILAVDGSARTEMMTLFLQQCIIPRCLFSAVDAVYCAKFATMLHTNKTVNWSTLTYYDTLLSDVRLLITSHTADEARRYGRFLAENMRTLARWHKSADVYKSSCFGFPGFQTKTVSTKAGEDGKKTTKNIGYEDFRHVMHKWHSKLTSAFKHLLTSKDYTMITNALLVRESMPDPKLRVLQPQIFLLNREGGRRGR